MALEQSTKICSVQRRVALRTFLSLCILLPLFAQASQAQNSSIASDQSGKAQVFSTAPNGTTSETDEINYGQVMRDVLSAALSKVPRSLVKKLLAADVRPECSVALLRTMRAFQNFEPWAMRLFDATGKYPTGALEATRADMGAFDECLETAVRDRDGNVLSRGQYCNLIVHVLNATAIQELVRSYEDFLPPKVFYFSKYGNPPEIPLARMAVCYIDECNQNDLQAMVDAVSIPFVSVEVSNCVTAEPRPWDKAQIAIVILAGILFVAIVLSTAVDYFVDEQSKWRKKHGILFQVAMAFSAISNTRMLSNVARKDQVDQYSLQFLHGVRFFTITHVLLGHINAVITDSLSRLLSLFEDTARWENMMVVAAFNGVDTFFFLSGFLMGYIINKQEGNRVVVFIIALIRRSIRRKSVALTVLAMLSLLGCAIGTWTMARSRLLPFLVIPFPQYRRMQSTINEYYVKPFYHAVCYFGGCMTSLIIPDFGGRKVSKVRS
ncbi:hypothetical protein HPB50_020040 [Hyalomma asiaticum]|uniref:Uncharacterized protein n=1 Tax=Hyalomma asiaticum TaxID=266040 RepID=A0ACB7SLU3_HYAAI|nr:hypothetical protein HPB50_020040 [Hyalomma asiaticum]